MWRQRYLPEGLVEGCALDTGCREDSVITMTMCVLPSNRFADQLRAEQYRHFRGETGLEEIVGVPVHGRA